MERQEVLSYEKAVEFIGGNSQYQKKCLIFVTLSSLVMQFVFVGTSMYLSDPKYRCLDSQNQKYFCSYKESCAQQTLTVASSSFKSLTREFNFKCNGVIYRDYIIVAAIFFGFFIGGVLKSKNLLKLDVRKSIVYSLAILGINAIVMGLAIYVIEIIYLNFFIFGYFISNFYADASDYINAISNQRFKNFYVYCIALSIAVGQLIFFCFFYIGFSWRTLYVVFFGFPLTYGAYFCHKFLLDSPYEAYISGDLEKCQGLLNLISIENSKPALQFKLDEPESNKSSITYVDLIRFESLKPLTIFFALFGFFLSFANVWTYFAVGNFGEDVHENYTVFAFGELLSILLFSIIESKFQRKNLLSISFIVIVVCGFVHASISVTGECYYSDIQCSKKLTMLVSGFLVRFFQRLLSFYINVMFADTVPIQAQGLLGNLKGHFSYLGALATPILFYLFIDNTVNIILALVGLATFIFYKTQIQEEKHEMTPRFVDERKDQNVPLISINQQNKQQINQNFNFKFLYQQQNLVLKI